MAFLFDVLQKRQNFSRRQVCQVNEVVAAGALDQFAEPRKGTGFQTEGGQRGSFTLRGGRVAA